jgi:hypothetical protein
VFETKASKLGTEVGMYIKPTTTILFQY